MIPKLSYEEIRSQDYDLFKSTVRPKISHANPMILYGIEFMLHRGTMSNDAAQKYVVTIEQDHKN
jgi:hypothetical protein